MHIAYMALVVFIIIVLHKSIAKEKIKMDLFLKISALVTLTLDPLYWWWEVDTYGQFNWATTMPLYICSLFWILMPIVAFSKKKGALYRASLSCVATVGLYGGIFGMVLNHHINNYGFIHFVSQRSLLYHAIMLTTIVLMWSTGYYRPQRVDRYLFILPLLSLLVPAFVVDKVYGFNYCYFNGGEGGVLTFFSDKLGIPLFVVTFYGLKILIIFVVLTLLTRRKTDFEVQNELPR